MKKCAACDKAVRKRVYALVLGGEITKVGRVCIACANAGVRVVSRVQRAPKKPKVRDPLLEVLAPVINQLQTYARTATIASKKPSVAGTANEHFQNGRSDGFEGAVVLLKRLLEQEGR